MELPAEFESMREHVKRQFGVVVPDEAVIQDSEDYFSYLADNIIIGWNRNNEIFWRNRDTKTE